MSLRKDPRGTGIASADGGPAGAATLAENEGGPAGPDRRDGQHPNPAQEAELSVAGAAAAIRRGEITAEALALRLLKRAREQANLNSFVTIPDEAVIEAARGADLARAAGRNQSLLGVPLAVKDSYLTRGIKTSFGTDVLRTFMPSRDAQLVRLVRQAGGIIFGKNNLVELSYGLTGQNVHHGQTLNPYNEAHVTGGSSSGGAASVASRIVPAAFGGDTVGSIRVPAALTGVVGYKPTPGRWPSDGIAPVSHTLDTPGLLARSVEDCALLDWVATGERPAGELNLKGVRIAHAPRQFLQNVDQEVEGNFHEVLKCLADAGAMIEEIALGPDFNDQAAQTAWTLFGKETRPAVMEFLNLENVPTSIDELIRNLDPNIEAAWRHIALPGGEAYPTDEMYDNVLNKVRPGLQQRLTRLVFSKAHYLILPTTPAPAPRIQEQRSFKIRGEDASDLSLSAHTIVASAAGLPAVSLPAGLSRDGLPLGIEFSGAAGADRAVLAIARSVEAILGPIPAPGVPRDRAALPRAR